MNTEETESSLKFITLEMVELAIENDTQMLRSESESETTYSHLETLLTQSFSSITILNRSFSAGLTKLSYSRPNIDFEDIQIFYTLILSLPSKNPLTVLMRSILSLLKRPRRKIENPEDIFFLMIILENPIFNSHSIFSSLNSKCPSSVNAHVNKSCMELKKHISKPLKYASKCNPLFSSQKHNTESEYMIQNTHSTLYPGIDSEIFNLALQILERVVAIMSQTSKRTRHYLLNWLSRYPHARFQSKIELLNAYISQRLYNLSRGTENVKPCDANFHSGYENNNKYPNNCTKMNIVPGSPLEFYEDPVDAEIFLDSTLVPNLLERNQQQALIQTLTESEMTPQFSLNSFTKKRHQDSSSGNMKVATYGKDWKISSFARVLAIFFNANKISHKVSISLFYNTMVDYIDIKADFDAWEKLDIRGSRIFSSFSYLNTSSRAAPKFNQSIWDAPLFAFCEYPFFLSMGTKTSIIEYDARRQMAHKAHEAFFVSLDTHIPQQMFLNVCIHRNNLLQDSFQIFETQENDLKKGIRVQFIGEPGIDVGGLKKEWFLLLIRDLFHSERGLFKTEEESGYSWFNLKTNQPLKYYKLTGIALGLALYNSTILDTNLPPIIFKKLLGEPSTLKDFKTVWPEYGKSLQEIMDYKGCDFENTFFLTFSVTRNTGKNTIIEENLIPNGSEISVTRENVEEYVKRIIEYHLDTSIKRLFEPLKQGFFKVVASNALTLFQPEEIELLIHGSDDHIDVDSLRAVTRYNHWSPKYSNPDQECDVIQWFWKYFKSLSTTMKRKLLMFVTGSDRIPATGIATMSFTITRLGGNSNRYPVSHTCFNELCLYEYNTKQVFVNMLTRAISESEGFGLK